MNPFQMCGRKIVKTHARKNVRRDVFDMVTSSWQLLVMKHGKNPYCYKQESFFLNHTFPWGVFFWGTPGRYKCFYLAYSGAGCLNFLAKTWSQETPSLGSSSFWSILQPWRFQLFPMFERRFFGCCFQKNLGKAHFSGWDHRDLIFQIKLVISFDKILRLHRLGAHELPIFWMKLKLINKNPFQGLFWDDCREAVGSKKPRWAETKQKSHCIKDVTDTYYMYL